MNKREISIIIGLILFIFFSFDVHYSVPHQANQTASISLTGQSTSTALFSVMNVVDGDTISARVGNIKETIRLIGVNTPETVDPRKPVQCFGKEASQFLKTMLAGKSVRLESDPTQSDRDKYRRLLRYVYLGDVLVNEKIISSGYGYEYTYDIPYKFQKEFKESETYAREGQLGLWSPTTCAGKL